MSLSELPPRVWAVHDGRMGIVSQVLGLAEAVGWSIEEKRIAIRFPWSRLTPQLWWRPLAALSSAGDALAPPWPDLVIGCGRLTAAPLAAVRRASGGRTFTVQIQDPKLPLAWYDLVVLPEHDRRRGNNVLPTRGAVHRVTRERLAAAAARFAPEFADLPRPLVAVLIGGNSKDYRLTEERLAAFADQLATVSRRDGAGLLVTPSRRTGPAGERILRERLAGLPARIWDGTGENPYFGYLALADAILVTEDSVSMVSEAATTGKPVHVVPLDGPGSRKFRRFHESLREAGVTRPFEGTIGRWSYEPLDETPRIAAEIRRLMAARDAA